MSDEQVKRIKADELTPDIRNANRGTERGRYALETSLREYGAGRSIVIDKAGRIIAGNKTLETAAEMGLDDVLVVQTDGRQIVAVQRMDLDLSQDDKARMLAYADNRVGQLDLDFDPAVIAEDIAAGLDLDLFWQDFELDEILEALQPEPTPGEDTEPEIDKAEELRQKWGVETGQLWQIGKHRLICGDCTDAEVVNTVCDGGDFHIMIGDPPYDFPPSKQALIIDQFDGVRVWFGMFPMLADVIRATITPIIYDIAWETVTLHVAPSPDRIGSLHKNIMIFADKIPRLIYDGGKYHGYNKLMSVVRMSYGEGKVYTFEKPVDLICGLIASYEGDVYDPFSGSGTTLIACEKTGRKSVGVEIDPKYVAVAIDRWHRHTGVSPVLLGS